MSISSIQSGSTYTGIAATGSSQSAQGSNSYQAVENDGSQDTKHGDGHIISELKDSLESQGFSQANSGMSKKDYMTAMHNFVHAAFAAAHSQSQTDRAGSQGANTSMDQSFQELSDAANNGNAPQGLQDAFAALQGTQANGAGLQATLAQVLSGMAGSQTHSQQAMAGGLVNVEA